MIASINESKILTKHISSECKCRFDGRKCNSDQWPNNNKCRFECKEHHICEKEYVWNPATCNCENRKYLASIIDDSAIICDEVIDADAELHNVKLSPKDDNKTNFNEKKVTCKTQNFYILLTFLLIPIALWIAVSIYFYLIKDQAKQKHLLPFHNTKLKQAYINNIN